MTIFTVIESLVYDLGTVKLGLDGLGERTNTSSNKNEQ